MKRVRDCAQGLIGRTVLVAALLGIVAHAASAETVRWNRAVMPRATAAALNAVMVPAFSRQTGLPCASCHYQFPQLTPFGRMFKLNGYTLTSLTTIRAHAADTTKRETLGLLPIPPVAAMVVASVTTTQTSIPGTQNTTASFPQQASLFFAGAVSTHVGIFSQFTYAAADGSLGIDNVDIRYANHAMMGEHDQQSHKRECNASCRPG